MMPDLPIRIYTPEPILGHPIRLLREMFVDLWAGRELAWRLLSVTRALNIVRHYWVMFGLFCRRLSLR